MFLMACMGGDTSNSVSTCTCRFKKWAVALLHRKIKRTFGYQVNCRHEPYPFGSGLRKFAVDPVVVIFFEGLKKITSGCLI